MISHRHTVFSNFDLIERYSSSRLPGGNSITITREIGYRGETAVTFVQGRSRINRAGIGGIGGVACCCCCWCCFVLAPLCLDGEIHKDCFTAILVYRYCFDYHGELWRGLIRTGCKWLDNKSTNNNYGKIQLHSVCVCHCARGQSNSIGSHPHKKLILPPSIVISKLSIEFYAKLLGKIYAVRTTSLPNQVWDTALSLWHVTGRDICPTDDLVAVTLVHGQRQRVFTFTIRDRSGFVRLFCIFFVKK